MPAPKAIIQKLQWWLKHRFGEKFKDIGNQLEHGRQEDWTDCGIVSVNTAAHELFRGEALWTVEKKQLERVAWFVKLCRAHIDDVRFLSSTWMGQDLTMLLEQINENVDDIHYPSMAIGSSTYQTTNVLPELPQNPAHSLPYILNPIPCNGNGDAPIFCTMGALQRGDNSHDADNIDMGLSRAKQTNDAESTEGPVVDQPKSYPIFLLKNGSMEETIRRRDEKAGNSDETANSKKRALPCEPNNNRQIRPCKVRKTTNVLSATSSTYLGESRSATWERCQNEKFLRGQIEADPHGERNFKAKIRLLDKNAHFFDSKKVRHLKCGKTIVMKYPYSVQNFKTHVLRCRGPSKSAKLPGGGMQLIHVFFKGTSTATTGDTKNPKVPCPGLTDRDYPSIAAYLTRTGAHGGGAPSVTTIAHELYGKKYQKLSEARKHHVKTAQRHEWHWWNDHVYGRVFATNCSKVSAAPYMPALKPSSLPSTGQVVPSAGVTAVACLNCRSLLVNKKFKNAVNVPQPPDSHYKYVNYEYRNKQLALFYGRCADLRAIIESTVRRTPF